MSRTNAAQAAYVSKVLDHTICVDMPDDVVEEEEEARPAPTDTIIAPRISSSGMMEPGDEMSPMTVDGCGASKQKPRKPSLLQRSLSKLLPRTGSRGNLAAAGEQSDSSVVSSDQSAPAAPQQKEAATQRRRRRTRPRARSFDDEDHVRMR